MKDTKNIPFYVWFERPSGFLRITQCQNYERAKTIYDNIQEARPIQPYLLNIKSEQDTMERLNARRLRNGQERLKDWEDWRE